MRPPAAPLSFGSTSSPASARRWKLGLMALAAIVAVLNLWSLSAWQRSLVPGIRGTLLAGFDPAVEAGGWQRITKLAPESPLRASGAAVGDAVRFHYRGEAWLRRYGTDERINVEWRSAAGVRPLILQPVAEPGFEPSRAIPGYISTWLARLFTLLIGALLALRRPDSPAVRALATSLILGSLGGYSLPGGALREQIVVWLNPFLEDIAGMCALWFAFQVQQDRSIWKKKSAMAIILVLFALLMVSLSRWALQWNLGYDAALWSAVPGLNWLSGFRGYTTTWVVVDVVTAAALGWSWRRASGAMRVRIAWIAVALGAPLLWDSLNGVVLQILSTEYSYPPLWTGLVFSYVSLGGALILGWAVLRHRVFDFGLVVQRALAYSIVSTMVVAAVGIAKWLTELMLQSASREHSTVRDAAVIVAVVIVFATLQQRVTKYVTRVFFSRWHRAAQELRDFVDQAAQMTDGEAMKQQFAAAVDKFTEGNGSAVYTADADETLHRDDPASLPSAPSSFGSNDEVVVKLRQGASRVDMSRLAAKPAGDWIFPMKIRGRLCGALLIGARTEGVSYRPEELSQLADSARSIGLTLESLRAAELQRKHDEIAQQLDTLRDANRSLAAENAALRSAPS